MNNMDYIDPKLFGFIFRKIKLDVWERDNYTCKYCGLFMGDLYKKWKQGKIIRAEVKLTVDHLIPKQPNELWRNTTMENLVTACSDCNIEKGGHKNFSDLPDKFLIPELKNLTNKVNM